MDKQRTARLANPTIATVAERLGVSMMTVSRVLNNKPGVAPATRERVLRAMEELGYSANQSARNLAGGASNLISLVLPNIWSGYMSEVARGVGASIGNLGYTLVIYATDIGTDRERIFKSLFSQDSAGLIMVGPCLRSEWVRLLLRQRRPCTIIDPCASDLALPCITTTNWQGSMDAMAHLIALGHRRIGFIAGSTPVLCNSERLRGYREGLSQAGIAWDPRLVRSGNLMRQAGTECVREWIENGDLPTAILAGNDDMALGVIDGLQAAKLRVPEDLSIAGFDDIPTAGQVYPGLTTVRQPVFELGKQAAEMVMAQIEGRDDVPTYVELPSQLVIRGSTSPPRSD
jgi:LacI family transcriptional regulator